jgi:hypothetical protein
MKYLLRFSFPTPSMLDHQLQSNAKWLREILLGDDFTRSSLIVDNSGFSDW